MQLPVGGAVLAVLALVALVVGIANMGSQPANPDEGRYSEISREMAASGDWITPRLNGIKYFEKPPLQYWATALAYRAFGEGEWVSRLYVGLCGLATILLVGYTALRLGDEKSALAAMLALVSSPYFMALGGIVTLDMGLTLWTTLTFCALLLAERSREDMGGQRPAWWGGGRRGAGARGGCASPWGGPGSSRRSSAPRERGGPPTSCPGSRRSRWCSGAISPARPSGASSSGPRSRCPSRSYW